MELNKSLSMPNSKIQESMMDEINSMLYITNIGFYPEAFEHYRQRKDGCKQHILIYCTAGSGWISVYGKRHTVIQNQYFIIPKNIPHSYGSNNQNPWSIYWIHFLGKLSNEYSQLTNNPETISPSNIDRIDHRIELFEEMFQNLELGFTRENIQYANICLMHFLASFKFLKQYRQIKKNNDSDPISKSIRQMKDWIHKPLTLAELANNTNLSVSQYSLLFKRKTGKSPLDYFINLKIQKSCQLLDNTNLKIKKIANKVGYKDPLYFSRIFTKNIGIPPKNYRKSPKG